MINVYWQRSILNCVPYVPCVLPCSRANVYSACSRANVCCVFPWSRALRADMPTFLACLPTHVPKCLSAMTSNNESKFTLRIQ